MDFVTRIETALSKRRAYSRTVREIRRMPIDTALDLDIHKPDARAIARRAVYGD